MPFEAATLMVAAVVETAAVESAAVVPKETAESATSVEVSAASATELLPVAASSVFLSRVTAAAKLASGSKHLPMVMPLAVNRDHEQLGCVLLCWEVQVARTEPAHAKQLR